MQSKQLHVHAWSGPYVWSTPKANNYGVELMADSYTVYGVDPMAIRYSLEYWTLWQKATEYCSTLRQIPHSYSVIQCCRDMVFSRYRLYRDMSKISRYSIAIFFSILIEQLFINNHTIFMQVEAAMLWWRHKNKHIKCRLYGAGGGRPSPGGWGGRKETLCTNWYTYRYT